MITVILTFLYTCILHYIATSRIAAATQEAYFTNEDEEKIRYMLSDRVGPATLAGYTNCGISIWKRFLATDRHWSNADLLLDNIVGLRHFQSDDDRIKLLVFPSTIWGTRCYTTL